MTTSLAGLFDSTTAITTFRAQLMGARAIYFANWTPDDAYLWEKLTAAEAELERRLRVYLGPVDIIPQDSSEVPPATRWVNEPGYDFTPDLFAGDRWGLIETRQRPINSVTSIRFAYPMLGGEPTAFNVPSSWMRIDYQYGIIQIVAATSLQTLPLNSFIMGVIGSGRAIPLMMMVRYNAGLTNTATQYPDVIPLIKKMATLSILGDLILPASGSISADGLSQSISFDYKSQSATLDEQIERLRSAIHGPRVMIA